MLKTTATALCLMLGLAAAHAQAPAPSTAPAPVAQANPQANPSDAMPPAAPADDDALPPPTACSFDKVYICEAKGCGPSTELGTIDLPARFLIHFGEQIIASTADNDLPHISSIQSVIGDGDSLILDGNDDMSAWAIQLSRTKPEATLTTLAGGKVLTAFGTCQPAP
ncbi:hypothetical protein Snov_3779 [Ancylobacter novellus DSM 506]|uniref:Uncharacterized protein n=1 Tax=Ancylobacter novellus (strain ATCC 8093 / DSM 506 / JCM 20403 / CCM 1077 / IAM 12100 / NBRC 12443 / NCIMB 10456) TaxID=639283 RepID=D6ZYT0_ANCN5|nr:hypothetical protein [Ancylobacter novellus]ADH91049.1 hypothetical protein Snov_3779 [Ancylobacter novellus DSM 506]